MSRIKKINDSETLSFRKAHHRTPSYKIINRQSPGDKNPTQKDCRISSKSPSYTSLNSNRKKMERASSLLKVKPKETKCYPRIEETSLSAARLNSWDKQLFQAKILREKLKTFHTEGFSEENHEKYVNLFEELIEKDLIFSDILMKIKESYTDLVQRLSTDLRELIRQVEKTTEEKDQFKRMLDRLAKENRDVGKNMENLEELCETLQKKLSEIQSIDMASMTMNSEKWKSLIYENGEYCGMLFDLNLDLKEYKYREEKMKEFVDVLKSRGVDVDDIYNEIKSSEDEFTEQDSRKKQKVPNLYLLRHNLNN